MSTSEPATSRALHAAADRARDTAADLADDDLAQRVRRTAARLDALADEAAAHARLSEGSDSLLTDGGGRQYHVACPDCADGEGLFESFQRARWEVLEHREETGHAVHFDGVSAE